MGVSILLILTSMKVLIGDNTLCANKLVEIQVADLVEFLAEKDGG